MKHLILAVSTMVLLSLPGWGQATPNQQAHAGLAAHRQEAQSNPERRHHRRKHHRHHHHHPSA
jgi:hypothetical protein